MLFNQENALYIYKYLMTQELSLHDNYPPQHHLTSFFRGQAKSVLNLSWLFSARCCVVPHSWSRYFTWSPRVSEICTLGCLQCLNGSVRHKRLLMTGWLGRCRLISKFTEKQELLWLWTGWWMLHVRRFLFMYSASAGPLPRRKNGHSRTHLLTIYTSETTYTPSFHASCCFIPLPLFSSLTFSWIL